MGGGYAPAPQPGGDPPGGRGCISSAGALLPTPHSSGGGCALTLSAVAGLSPLPIREPLRGTPSAGANSRLRPVQQGAYSLTLPHRRGAIRGAPHNLWGSSVPTRRPGGGRLGEYSVEHALHCPPAGPVSWRVIWATAMLTSHGRHADQSWRLSPHPYGNQSVGGPYGRRSAPGIQRQQMWGGTAMLHFLCGSNSRLRPTTSRVRIPLPYPTGGGLLGARAWRSTERPPPSPRGGACPALQPTACGEAASLTRRTGGED